MADRNPPRAVVNIWDLIEDPGIPRDVAQRAFARRRAAAEGITPPAIPDEDLPHLARHAHPTEGRQ